MAVLVRVAAGGLSQEEQLKALSHTQHSAKR